MFNVYLSIETSYNVITKFVIKPNLQHAIHSRFHLKIEMLNSLLMQVKDKNP